jgi:hypothetical protein
MEYSEPVKSIEVKILFDNSVITTTQVDYITLIKINDILTEYKQKIELMKVD